MTLTVRTGDTLPVMEIVLSAKDPVIFPVGTTLRVLGRKNRTLVIDEPVPLGQVTQVGDTSVLEVPLESDWTDEAGLIRIEVEAIYPGGAKQTFPTDPDDGLDVELDYDAWTA